MKINFKVFYKFILPFLMGVVRHAQKINEIAEFVVGQYFKKH